MSDQALNLVSDLPNPHQPPGTSFVPSSSEDLELPAKFLLDHQATFRAAETALFRAYHAMVQQFFDDCWDSWACASCNDIHGFDDNESAGLWYTLYDEMCQADEERVDFKMLDDWVMRANHIANNLQEVEGTEGFVMKKKPVRNRLKVWDVKKQGCDCQCHDGQGQDDYETSGTGRGRYDRGGQRRGGSNRGGSSMSGRGGRGGRRGRSGRGGAPQRGQWNGASESHVNQTASQIAAHQTSCTPASWEEDNDHDSQASQGFW